MSLFNRINGGRGASGGSSSSSPPVCKFYLEGRCRFGDSCKNYHPPRESSSAGSSGRQSLPYHLSVDGIKADLTQGDDRPTWPLSAYGPGRDAPRQLLEGVLEQSPEELRVQFYVAKAAGSTQQYEENEKNAVDQANQRVQQILSDIDGAIKYIIDGKDKHPNRDDHVLKNAGNFNWTTKPSLNQAAASTSNGPAFGQSSATGSSSTSAFGKPSGSAFGQPSSLTSGTPFGGSGSTGSSPFGSSQPATTSAFGRPSAVGSGSAFGQPSSLGGGSTAFGKPSSLGGAAPFGAQNSSNGSTFGQASSNREASPFGQTTSNTGGPAFGQPSAPGSGSAFGQASTPGSGTAFGKPSPFGAAASATPAFGSSTPFGAQASPKPSVFGQSSQPAQQPSAFGQPSQPAPQQSTFGKPTAFGSNGATTSTSGQPAFGSSTAFGAPSGTSAFGQPSAPVRPAPAFGAPSTNGTTSTFGSQSAARPAPGASTFGASSTTAPGQRISNFRGQPVTYHRLDKIEGKVEDKKEYPFYRNPATGKPERVWLPDGPPGPNADVEAPPQTYEALGAALQQIYDYVRDTGTFKDGIVPEVPPKREWVNWEL